MSASNGDPDNDPNPTMTTPDLTAGNGRQSSTRTPGSSSASTTVQKAAVAVGLVFLLVGVLGFVPGITTNYGAMSFASHMSQAKLLGLFQVSVLHNVVHLLFGMAGLFAARGPRSARLYFLISGAVYLVLFIYGIVVVGTAMSSMANFVPVNGADNWLHLVLGGGMSIVGIVLGRAAISGAAAT
ncbi:DUF4383 domain-containing protein [Microlunatus soli]|uniref:DUF4383 domain-containing protein n=1 Tax=Microlunatus soli TaxID=630515 RepID=A0A1H1N9B0_9ACTN|nr:DUF4383 domain-containing protein [Microlunatus soli]SDR95671.1 protein of unknown function [Microlunatus soli]